MKIIDIEVKLKAFRLVKPYRIANKTIDKVSNCIVRITLANGLVGLGAGAPIDFLTGETPDSCLESLSPKNLVWLFQKSMCGLPSFTKELQKRFKQSPAAAAALDIALYDAYGKLCQLPIVDLLGRAHTSLPTSITIGIKDLEGAIKEAHEYIERGFKILKIKLGEELQKDIETVVSLRQQFAEKIKIRVDMNQGYSLEELTEFVQKTKHLNIELIEQPFPKKVAIDYLKQLPNDLKNTLAADESLVSLQDMFELTRSKNSYGIFNIKLMKCGGISTALDIAKLAELANVDLMWGCMDETVISISAALHAAFASSKTKYLDLDGSFDLADDLAQGGFVLENGELKTLNKPGLGVNYLD